MERSNALGNFEIVMLIIAKRFGYLVPIITFGCLIGTQLIANSMTNDPEYYQSNGWIRMAAMLAASLILLLISRKVDAMHSRELIDKNTGEEIVLKPDDSFFFIPMRYWSIILFLAGIWFY